MIRHVFTFLLLGFLPAAFAQNPRPNIVLILADDMGYSDIGSYGGEIETPALDRLATDGVRFRNFYNTARCSTSRAALLTGLYPWQAGVGLLDEDLGAPGYQGFLNQQCVTIAEILGEAGYHTSIAGKWHIGKERPNWPIDRGFQRQFTSPSGGGYYFRPVQPQIGARTIYLDENPLSESALDTWDGDPDPFYSTDDFTDAAILFIDEAVSENKPFLVYLPFIAPHWPLEAPEAEVSKYLTSGLYDNGWGPVRTARLAKQKGPDGIAEALNGSDEEWELSADSVNWSPNSDAIQRMAVHAAVVDRMDQNIARLIDHLENTLGILDNTLIIFVSDNGASSDGGDVGTGSLGNPVGGTNSVDIRYGKGWANASDTPFRGYKKYTENGGIMTPFILHWPDGITRPGGSVLGKRAHLIDVMPTLLEVTGISYPETFNGNSLLPMEGESFADLLTPGGLETRSTPLYFSHETRSGILDGDWKGVAQDDPLHDPFEVYDLSKDPSELNNVAAEEPGIQAALRDAWFVWAHRANVKDWPISNLPKIQLSPRNQTIIRSETTTFSLRRDRSSGSNTVSLSYQGNAREGVDYSPLPAQVSLDGTTAVQTTVTPLASAEATDPVTLEVQVLPTFWYVEPEFPARISMNFTRFDEWAETFLSEESGLDASPFGDPDIDGFLNFQEFWMGSDPVVADPANPTDFSFVVDPETRQASLAHSKGLSSDEVNASISFTEDLMSPWTDLSELDIDIQKQRVGDLVNVLMILNETAQTKPRYFARMVLEWMGGAVGDPLMTYPFTDMNASAEEVYSGIAPGTFDVRTSAFPENISGFSSLNDTSFLRTTHTGENVQAALDQEDYHQVEIDFTGNPTDLVTLEFEHKASTDVGFTSHIAVFASTDGFSTPPVPGDALGISTVEVEASQSPLVPIRTAVFPLFGPGVFKQFTGTLRLRFYYFDDANSDSCIHRLDTLRLYGF